MINMPGRAWVEINLDNIANNLNEIKKSLGSGIMINAVIKADGYGHGAVMTAKVLEENGVDMLSVATLDEALQLRKHDIDAPILVLGHTDAGRLDEIIQDSITVSVFDIEQARWLSDEARANGVTVDVHIKIDTGMNRIGFHYTDFDAIVEAYALEGLTVKGTFTHFSTADEKDTSYTDLQYERFDRILNMLLSKGFDPGIRHANNSGGTLLHEKKGLDMVRTGLIIYGLYPSEHSRAATDLSLMPAMAFKAKIIKVKTIDGGMPVSYGNTYITKGKTRIATIACGYADGYSRTLSGSANVIIRGHRVPVIGNICMDMCMADITSIEEPVNAGDDAVLFNGEITADDLAELNGTINYEIVCRIGMRIPRVYLREGKITMVSNYLLPT